MQDSNTDPPPSPSNSISAADLPPDRFPYQWTVETRELKRFAFALIRSEVLSRASTRLSIVILTILLLGALADVAVDFPLPRWTAAIPALVSAYYIYTIVRTYRSFVSSAADEWSPGEIYFSGFGATGLWIRSSGSARALYFRDVQGVSVAGRVVVLVGEKGRKMALPIQLCPADQLDRFDRA
jgi:hypothetical protein